MVYTIDYQQYIMNEINNDLSMLKQLKYIDESSKIDGFINGKLKKAWDFILSIIEKIRRGISALIRKIKSLNLRERIKKSADNVDNNSNSTSVSTFQAKEKTPFIIYTWDTDSIFDAIENIVGMEQSAQAYDIIKSEIDNVWFDTNNPKSFVRAQSYSDYNIKTLLDIEAKNSTDFNDFNIGYTDCKKFVEKLKRDSLNANLDDASDMSIDTIELMGYALTKADTVISGFYNDNATVIFNNTGK